MKLEDLECKDNISLDNYIDFKEDVKKSMENPEWLGDLTKEDLLQLLDNGSKIWIYYKGTIPVCSAQSIPANEDLGKEFNLNYKEVIEAGPMMVNPEYIGNNLQLQMLKKLQEYSKKHNYKYILGTVHPNNIYSINNLTKAGFKLLTKKEYPRGERNVYIKKI